MENCIFCKIANGEIPSARVLENEELIAINDINPKARVHILIIPKKHVQSVDHLEKPDEGLVGKMVFLAREIAKSKNLTGYKLVINVGKEGGQTVEHLHLHLLSGDSSSELKV